MTTLSSPLIKLETLPSSSDAHLWADFIELLCLANVDGQISKADVLDRVCERADDLNEGGEEFQEDEDTTPIEHNDRWRQRASDWFRQLEYRAGAFADFYPFALSDHGDVLNLKSPISTECKLYLFLLFASCLRCFNKQHQNKIASVFEVVSWQALQTYLPDSSKSYLFGKNPLNKGHYSGKLWHKIQKLAGDLGETVQCKEENFKPRNTGDGGLDIVAWLPPGDTARGFLLLFGQCKCGQDWIDGQAETGYDRWKNYLTFTIPPVRLTFIPFCFRSSDGDWHNPTDIYNTILIDRLRLIHLLQEKYRLLEKQITEQVNPALSYREPIN